MGGIGGIYYQAVSQYARDHGITGENFRVFRAFLGALDAEFLQFEAERQEADRKKRENKGSG
jgi:hypothetical protein